MSTCALVRLFARSFVVALCFFPFQSACILGIETTEMVLLIIRAIIRLVKRRQIWSKLYSTEMCVCCQCQCHCVFSLFRHCKPNILCVNRDWMKYSRLSEWASNACERSKASRIFGLLHSANWFEIVKFDRMTSLLCDLVFVDCPIH